MASKTEIVLPDRRGLRSFALQVGLAIIVVFGLLLPWLLGFRFPRWPWVVGGVLIAWGLLLPATLAPVYRFWMRFAEVLHRITSPIILGIVFYLVVLPMALLMRIAGRDPLRRATRTGESTYRVPSTPVRPDNLQRPF
jgi:hypothetical protein